MKNKAAFLLSLFFISVSIGFSQNIVSINVSAGDTQKDATEIITKAIKDCKNKKASKLVISKGVYHFYPYKATEAYCTVSNNDNGLKSILFQIKGMNNLEIDCSGSKFIFHGNILPFNIDNSEHITIKNVFIDWERSFHSQGKVIAVDKLKKTFDIAISNEYPYRIENGNIVFIGEGWKQDIQANLFFDTKTKAPVYQSEKYSMDMWNPLLNTLYTSKELKKNIIRVYDTIAPLPEIGWVWASSGGTEPSRKSPAFRIIKSKSVNIHNITVHQAGGMGLIAERSADLTVKKFDVKLPQNSDRVVTTTADATHFVNCRGKISLDSCYFENMLDDGVNVHGTYARITKVLNDSTIEVFAPHEQQNLIDFALAGDSLKLYDNESLNDLGNFYVTEFELLNSHFAIITFRGNASKPQINFGVENLIWHPDFTITNSIVCNNRARGLLLSTKGKIVIEKNRFLQQSKAAISILGDMNFWFESGGVTDVEIRNNYFLNSCTNGSNQSVIYINPKILNISGNQSAYHKNILIEDNVIETFDRPILDAMSVKGIIVRRNVIRKTSTFKPIYPNKAVFSFTKCEHIKVSSNSYLSIPLAKINLDSMSAASLFFLDNKNFELKK